MSTAYHAKFFAHELTKRCPSDSVGKLAASLADAQVDLNPHQIDAALFAFRSPLSKGAILADERYSLPDVELLQAVSWETRSESEDSVATVIEPDTEALDDFDVEEGGLELAAEEIPATSKADDDQASLIAEEIEEPSVPELDEEMIEAVDQMAESAQPKIMSEEESMQEFPQAMSEPASGSDVVLTVMAGSL